MRLTSALYAGPILLSEEENVSRPRTWSRRTSAGLLASVVAAGVMTVAGGATTASADPSGETDTPKSAPAATLGSRDAKLLTDAQAKGERAVTLIVATDQRQTKDVAARLTSLGATVSRRFDSVGYLLATVPTAQVLKAAKLPGVAAVDLDDTIPLPDPHPGARAGAKAAVRQAKTVAAPGPDTPASNPFMPTNETGAVSFKQQHPQWDGRGVTIGIMDSGVDLDSPALQKTTTGERKIVDWLTATDPLEDSSWRAMITEVTGPTFTAAGATWTAPAGTWKFDRFAESITKADDAAGDVNRDGDTTDTWGILYDPVSHDIRVDVNQNHDFTDDAVMRPYKEKFDVGHFGTDNPATAVREQMPFVVEYREDVDTTPVGGPGPVDFVNIGIIEAEHGTHVAGITAANDMFGNSAFDGAAPGAKLVSARACSWGGGCTYAALTTGMVELVVNRKVDLVNVSIGGLPALNDGNDARATLYNRLINDYGVQLFISDGNDGPGVNTTGDPATATDVVSVASSISRESWLANYGSVVRTPYELHPFSSRGPREDGGFKPNITAPGSAISTTPVFEPGVPVAEAGYSLPPGYSMLQGTSMAAPQATGGAALLLSAARANDLGVTPAALRRAIYSSGKWITGAPAHAQGNGLLDVNGAWRLLAKGVETRDYDVSAPVCSPLADQLATPGRGAGIYNRCTPGDGGQKPGVAKRYTVKITRTSGPKGSVKHNLTWVGNDGTFRGTPKSVDLPLNRAVSVSVEAKAGVGAHSAILRVDDPKTTAVDFELLNVVVIGETPKKPDFSFTADGSVERNGFTSYFVDVPPGAGALQVNLSRIATGSQTRFIAINPYGLHVETNASTSCYTNYSDAAACKPQERDYQNPLPGIWEIEIEARRTTPSLDNPFRLTAEVQGVAVDPEVVELPSVPAGAPTEATWSLKNNFGPVVVTPKGGPLASAVTARPTITEHTTQEYTVEVPAGATTLTAAIGSPANLGADLDLYVYLGSTEVGRSADGDAEEAVTIANPAAGSYRIVVDGYNVDGAGGSTAYDYRDSFTAPSLGALTAPASTLNLAYGATASVTGSVTAKTAPAAGRKLYGELSLVSDQGATVGRGAVSISAVS